MDQAIRNKLRSVVTQCRKLLEESVSKELQGTFGIYASGKKDAIQIDDEARLSHLAEEERAARRDILDHYEHIQARGFKPREALEQLVREVAFTHLNRLCAYKMMEAREVYVGGQKFRQAVSRGVNSNGVMFYLADHPEDERLFKTGQQELAYRHFLDWLGETLSEEIGVLFSPNDPANRLYPPQRVLDQVLDLLNEGDIKPDETELRKAWPEIWSQDETIGWVYQYFTPKELRDQARKESQAPRNSYELAFRNQFFTPRYVVEFLTDNTLGRIWYEMRQRKTRLKDQCRYMVRRPDEVFLSAMIAEGNEHFSQGCEAVAKLLQEVDEATFPLFDAAGEAGIQRMIDLAHCVNAYERMGDEAQSWWNGQQARITEGALEGFSTQDLLDFLFMTCRADRHGGDGSVYTEPWFAKVANEIRARALRARQEDTTQEQLLKCPVFIQHRPKKDPRELKILDPACGSGHFLLYCFDLLLTIYEEAYADPDLAAKLKGDYPTVEALRQDVPRLILAHNLHGIDIDLRATQIAALALWLRCQRAYREMGLKQDRPKITKSNIVCAEPMPGEKTLLDEFLKTLKQDRLEVLIGRVMQLPEGKRIRATESMVESLNDLVRLVWDKMQLAGEAGSLLKIEEELQEAVRKGQEEWEEKQPLFRFTDFNLREEPKESYLRFVPGDGVSFWERAESLVMAALHDFATYAKNGRQLQRRLFAEDAVQGFAFVDLCRLRFDVALTNPPFGDPSKCSKRYVEAVYPRSKTDVYAAFVERLITLLQPHGLMGAITSRTGFFLTSFRQWRNECLLQDAQPTTIADLGCGVLDTAMVETAAYCLAVGLQLDAAVFCRLVHEEDKPTLLFQSIDGLRKGSPSRLTFAVSPRSFAKVPGAAFAYWVTEHVRHLFTEFSAFEMDRREVKVGGQTSDDFRYLRLFWETPLVRPTQDWRPYQKGGDYSPFYLDIPLVADWDQSRQTYREFFGRHGRPNHHPSSYQYFFRKGLAYTPRTQRGLSFRVHPEGCIFANKGPVMFAPDDILLPLFGLTNSSAFRGLASLQMAFGSYEVGVIQRTPIPDLCNAEAAHMGSLARAACEAKRRRDTANEISHVFYLPCLLQVAGSTLTGRITAVQTELMDIEASVARYEEQIDEIAFRLYGIGEKDRKSLEQGFRGQDWGGDQQGQQDEEREEGDAVALTDHRSLVVDVLSYSVGCSLGRWDVEYARGERRRPDLPDPFAAFPVCSSGMLQGRNGSPASSTPHGYPLEIDWEGIIPDDTDHSDDILRRVREVLELIWKDRAEAIEREACEILGVKELRDYFRRPGKGGFWDDHVSRYSKSRRKAPIYWLLQSSRKNYALWLYYHRLDKDLLFKALVNYVEPKIRLEESCLGALRGQKAGAGESGKGAKKVEKEIEKQEDLVSELRDFEDKLRRAANLHLEPDLNDGVVLNIAPLHELVPWKEAKKYWQELLEGKYEWSTIGKQLREKGIVKAEG